MYPFTPHLSQAAEIATAFLRREVDVRRQIDTALDPASLWAAVDTEGQIYIGNPVLRDQPGFYVDYQGDVELHDGYDTWTLEDFDDIVPSPRQPQ